MLDASDMVRFWARMSHIFGYKWDSHNGPALDGDDLSPAAKQWRYDLRDYDRVAVQRGLQAIYDQHLKWPPTPIEFMELCDDTPSLAQVLDTETDYGEKCRQIRRRMDFWTLDDLPSARRLQVAKDRYEMALATARAQKRAAIGNDRVASHIQKIAKGLTA